MGDKLTISIGDLKDGDMPLLERIDVALRRITRNEGQMRIPPEATDVDMVLCSCRDRIAELEPLTPRLVNDAASEVPNGPVLAWDGFHWHRAEYFRYRAVESFFDDESVFDDIDDEGIAWMREGWYESIGSLLPDYDAQWFKIEQPVTHWLPLPKDGPAATREARL